MAVAATGVTLSRPMTRLQLLVTPAFRLSSLVRCTTRFETSRSPHALDAWSPSAAMVNFGTTSPIYINERTCHELEAGLHQFTSKCDVL